MSANNTPTTDRVTRWRLVLGEAAEMPPGACSLSADQAAMDRALAALYEDGGGGGKPAGGRQGGLGASAPNVARWLGDIRQYFPSSVVQVMQKDALERLGLRRMLLEPELLSAVQPDVHLVGTLMSLGSVLPARTRETARLVVRKVVEDLEKRLASPLRQAVAGALNRAERNRRPRHHEIDWGRTVRLNLKHYQPEYRTVIPERLIGHGRKRGALRDVILCVDQSGSMASSVVYSGVFGATLASLPTLRTRMVVFDTAVVDLTEEMADPVDLLFGVQLGGGTDINRALAYCQGLVRAPHDTILVLISDLYEGGNREEMIQRAAALAGSGVRMIALLALSDDGAPSYDSHVAGALAALDVPCFACTPDLFPELMAAAITRSDVSAWAAARDIAVARRTEA